VPQQPLSRKTHYFLSSIEGFLSLEAKSTVNCVVDFYQTDVAGNVWRVEYLIDRHLMVQGYP